MPTFPPLTTDQRQAVLRDRLHWLSIGYYVSGILGILCVSILIFHFLLLSALSFMPESLMQRPACIPPPPPAMPMPAPGEPMQPPAMSLPAPPMPMFPAPGNITTPGRHKPLPKAERLFFRMAAAVIALIILGGWTLGALTIYAGRCISKRSHRLFVLIMAGVNCLWVPFGTLLGVATFVTLSQPGADEEYPA